MTVRVHKLDSRFVGPRPVFIGDAQAAERIAFSSCVPPLLVCDRQTCSYPASPSDLALARFL